MNKITIIIDEIPDDNHPYDKYDDIEETELEECIKPDETEDIVMKAMGDYIADMALNNADPEKTRVAVDMSRYIIQAMKANKHE